MNNKRNKSSFSVQILSTFTFSRENTASFSHNPFSKDACEPPNIENDTHDYEVGVQEMEEVNRKGGQKSPKSGQETLKCGQEILNDSQNDSQSDTKNDTKKAKNGTQKVKNDTQGSKMTLKKQRMTLRIVKMTPKMTPKKHSYR